MGRHFSADLYFCQNELWRTPDWFYDEIHHISHSLDDVNEQWNLLNQNSEKTLICGEYNDFVVFMQVFPEKRFLALDIFCWQSELNLQQFCESLIELFAPQVIATETRLRAEHLD